MARFVKWRGREVFDKAQLAAARGIDRVMADSAEDAKSSHTFRNDTVTLEGGIRVQEFARDVGSGVIAGLWGVTDVDYAIFVELGTNRARAFPFLRPAADRNYPGLAKAIRQEFRGI